MSVRTRVFEKILNMVNPAYYLSVDPRGFNMEYFLNTLHNQFDPSRGTRIPHFDLRGKQYPATLDDRQDWDRVERRCLCGLARILWEQICDFLDGQLTTTELCREGCVWHKRNSARVELESHFGALDERLFDCVVDYIVDIMGMTVASSTGGLIPRPESPPVASPKKQRRSRRKDTFLEEYVERGMLSDRGDSLIWSDDDIQLYPSDLDDGLV